MCILIDSIKEIGVRTRGNYDECTKAEINWGYGANQCCTSAPSPNLNPSANRVEALWKTQAESTWRKGERRMLCHVISWSDSPMLYYIAVCQTIHEPYTIYHIDKIWSTCWRNLSADDLFSVMMHSVWPEPQRFTWATASSRDLTTSTDIVLQPYSVLKSSTEPSRRPNYIPENTKKERMEEEERKTERIND